MNTLPNIDISPEHWRIVLAILKNISQKNTVWAFGSRVTRTAKPYSDLDLAIIGDTALPIRVLAGPAHDFTESSLPFKVDLISASTFDLPPIGILETLRISFIQKFS